MKKNLMLLVLGFAFSISTFASNVGKKENAVFSPKNSVSKFSKLEEKKFREFCLAIYGTFSTCPDGSEYLAFIDVFLVDCNTDATLGVATIYESTSEENCNGGGNDY